MMDTDPESARRAASAKTRETISQVATIYYHYYHWLRDLFQLEDALHLSAQDLKYASSTIQADLDRFQRQKSCGLREMSISMARSHGSGARRCHSHSF